MPTLKSPHKRFLVQCLAMYDTPTEAAEALLEEHGVKIDRQQAYNYDASKERTRKRMSAELVRLFDSTREMFVSEAVQIPIALRAFRLRVLAGNERKARKMGNLPLSNQTLEQAAKEVGDAYTNRKHLEHTVAVSLHPSEWTEEELRAYQKNGTIPERAK